MEVRHDWSNFDIAATAGDDLDFDLYLAGSAVDAAGNHGPEEPILLGDGYVRVVGKLDLADEYTVFDLTSPNGSSSGVHVVDEELGQLRVLISKESTAALTGNPDVVFVKCVLVKDGKQRTFQKGVLRLYAG